MPDARDAHTPPYLTQHLQGQLEQIQPMREELSCLVKWPCRGDLMPDVTLGSSYHSTMEVPPQSQPRASPSPPHSSISCLQPQPKGRQEGLLEATQGLLYARRSASCSCPPPLHF